MLPRAARDDAGGEPISAARLGSRRPPVEAGEMPVATRATDLEPGMSDLSRCPFSAGYPDLG